MASSVDCLLFLPVLPLVSWDDCGDGWRKFPETFMSTGSTGVSLPAFLSGKMRTGLQHWNQRLSWIPCKAQQFCWGPWLEKLHVVLRDEASLSIQSPLQPARLLRWMDIIKDRACYEWELRVVFSFAGIQGLCLPERCAVWRQEFI